MLSLEFENATHASVRDLLFGLLLGSLRRAIRLDRSYFTGPLHTHWTITINSQQSPINSLQRE